MPHSLVNSNVKLRTTIDPTKSFILDELTNTTIEEFVLDGAYFNRQPLGVRVKEFEKENIINKRYQIVATYNDAPQVKPSNPYDNTPTEDTEYIAILESLDIPLYAILYDISYTQFVYSERLFSDYGKQLVDHSIASRAHA
jgi:hypothetical protein